jgi:3-phosphoshikimate 1-carboxyvinyltransferase
VRGWPETTTQAGSHLVELLPLFGARISHTGSQLTVEGTGTITGAQVDLSTGGELVPTIAALAALANTPTRITGVGHIRHHETDRLASLAAEINGLGGSVNEIEDGLIIEPAPLHGGVWHTYHDHRMATAGALIGLVVPEVRIHNVGTTAKTLPQFTELWLEMIH